MRNTRGVLGLDFALYALLLGAAAFGVWSSFRIADLQQSLIKTGFDLGHARIGDWLPSMELPLLQSPDSTARLASPRPGNIQVLYFFSPACKFCQASAPHVERMYRNVQGQPGIEMYAVSTLDSAATAQYLQRTGSAIPTVVLPSKREINLYRLNVVPILFILDEGGRVIFAKYGELSDKDVPSLPAGSASGSDANSGQKP